MRMTKHYIFLFGLFTLSLGAQDFRSDDFKIKKVGTVNPTNFTPDFDAGIKQMEMPVPGGDSYKDFLGEQKVKSRELYPITGQKSSNKTQEFANDVLIGRQTETYRILPNGSKASVDGGIPNDNTLAISNNGLLVAGFNRALWAYDYNNNAPHFSNYVISLKNMAGDVGFGNYYYDPKLIYDPTADRFILTFLKNNTPSTNRIFVCFSTTNDPKDAWNVYSLPGNPLDNGRWTDYPAVSITDSDFFVTGNLIVPGVSWQVGFDGSVIWQINKEDGYNNEEELSTTLYSQIKHNDWYTRNLHPVRGANGIAEKQYFLSNRNFDLTNDTVFVMHITGDQSDINSELIIDYSVTDEAYGFPPNGRQEDTDVSEPTSGLQTNDARVLGAFLLENKIQFVANTINPLTGLSAVYHGFIDNPGSSNRTITGIIIGNDSLDLAYPNIAFSGKEDCEIQSIIGFDFSSFKDHPGVGVVFHDNQSQYSKISILKNGGSYVNRLGPPQYLTSYERWGDYLGIQRKFNSPGTIYTTGYFTRENHMNSIWVSELFSPDTNFIQNVVADGSNLIFPNPIGNSELINIQFNIDKKQTVRAYIFDLNGKLIGDLAEKKDCIGTNLLSFSTYPLASGTYIVKLLNENGDQILREKFIKN